MPMFKSKNVSSQNDSRNAVRVNAVLQREMRRSGNSFTTNATVDENMQPYKRNAQTLLPSGNEPTASHWSHDFSQMPVRSSIVKETGSTIIQRTPEQQSPPASPGTPAVAGQSPTAGSSVVCTPRGVSRRAFLAATGNRRDIFGLTVLSGQVTYPAVGLTRAGRRFRVQHTQAALPTIQSIYTQSGRFSDGETRIFPGSSGCPRDSYPVQWRITPRGAAKIGAGEQEHCNDFQYAFDVSLRRYADAVNQLAQSQRTFSGRRSVIRHLTRVTHVSPADWQSTFECLARKTLLRDTVARGAARGWHTPISRNLGPDDRAIRATRRCRYFERRITASSLPQVGRHPSSRVITGCGLRPQTRRTSGP